jgi:glyceraldehyde-3-phosphate dehydrogenase/erythrose-4-phosphate dehydrogenase
MPYRIAINGYGRIGRCVMRAFYESSKYPDLSIVAINDVADSKTLAHLTRYDSTHGRFAGSVVETGDALVINGDHILVSNTDDLAQLPWAGLNIDLVMECSGAFTDRVGLSNTWITVQPRCFSRNRLKAMSMQPWCTASTTPACRRRQQSSLTHHAPLIASFPC